MGEATARDAERLRGELRVHCYRMLGSLEEAEDAVQETLLRAWRATEDPGNARAWLYKVATNVCLDAPKARARRVPSLHSFADVPWLEPIPDTVLDAAADEAVIERETIALTFLAVIQLLPARQRAALILRDVLGWSAAEAGDILDLTVPALNSALQRARETLRTQLPVSAREAWERPAPSGAEAALLDAYMRAHESGDPEATLALIADDIRVTMPPQPYLFEGRDAILGLVERSRGEGEWRLVPVRANRQPAAGCYLRRPGQAAFSAFKIDVLRIAGGRIAEVTTFGVKHFPAFGLAPVLP